MNLHGFRVVQLRTILQFRPLNPMPDLDFTTLSSLRDYEFGTSCPCADCINGIAARVPVEPNMTDHYVMELHEQFMAEQEIFLRPNDDAETSNPEVTGTEMALPLGRGWNGPAPMAQSTSNLVAFPENPEIIVGVERQHPLTDVVPNIASYLADLGDILFDTALD